MNITIETTVSAPLKAVWDAWVLPEHIVQWNFASADWCCPAAKNDLRLGGHFCYRMAAKDDSMAFDFTGVYSRVEPQQAIGFTMDDGRQVEVLFEPTEDGIRVIETFAAEEQNDVELQRQGWQAILEQFRQHVEKMHA